MKTKVQFIQWFTMLVLIVTSTELMAQPGPYPTPGNHTVCVGQVAPYGVINTAGSTYAWSIIPLTGGNGTITPGNSNLTSVTWTSVGTCKLQVIETNSNLCPGLPVTIIVTVNPVPAINPMPATICSGGTFTVTPVDGVNGTVPAGTTYSWSAPTVTGGITGGAAGVGAANISGTLTNPTNASQTATYTVTPITGSCPGATFTVTVTVDPVPAITNMVASICSGGSFTAAPSNGANGVVPVGTTYSWPAPTVTGGITGGVSGSGAANISGTLTNPTNSPQTATYTVTPTSGSCPGATFTVIVTVNPAPAITNMVATICSGGTFTATPTNGLNGVVPAGTTYTWAAPTVTGGITGGAAGTAAANISGTLTNPTNTVQTATYTVTPTSGTCPGTNFTVIVTVNPTPAVTAMTATICSGGTFTSTPANVVNGVVPAGTTYTWSAPTVTGGMTGGAAGTAAANISGTLTNPTGSVQTATYTVTPTSGSCPGATFTVTVTVNPNPVPTITGPLTMCIGTAGNVYTTEAGMSNYQWTVSPGGTPTGGGTITDPSVTVTWTVAGAQTVSVNYTNLNGCTAPAPTTVNITVTQLPVTSQIYHN